MIFLPPAPQNSPSSAYRVSASSALHVRLEPRRSHCCPALPRDAEEFVRWRRREDHSYYGADVGGDAYIISDAHRRVV